jgi:exopolyphosphatase/guanosine-5'-triphosphate,3'-diphosphate pyrophosphatase
VQQASSFRLGVIRLGERFVKSDPLTGGDERRLVRHIRHELGDYPGRLAKAGYTRVIGTSGTVLALGSLALQVPSDVTIHHRRVGAKAIRTIRRQVASMTLTDRLALPGLDARRADLIVPGAVLLDTILRQLGADEIMLCELSLREGAILDYIRRNLVHIERVERYPDVRRRSVIELAVRCHYAADHAHKVARLALAMFDETRPVHGLDDRAREWLDFAGILHDVGVHISYERHHRHSYYLVKNGDLRGFEPDDRSRPALVARYHRRGRREGHECSRTCRAPTAGRCAGCRPSCRRSRPEPGAAVEHVDAPPGRPGPFAWRAAATSNSNAGPRSATHGRSKPSSTGR